MVQTTYLWETVLELGLIQHVVFEKTPGRGVSTDGDRQDDLLDIPEAEIRVSRLRTRGWVRLRPRGDAPCSLEPGLETRRCNSIPRGHGRLQALRNSSGPSRYRRGKLGVERVLEAIRNVVGPVGLCNALVSISLVVLVRLLFPAKDSRSRIDLEELDDAIGLQQPGTCY